MLRGWAGPELLDSYEAERRPVAAHAVARSADPLGSRRPADAEVHADIGGRIAHAWSGADSTLDLLGPGLTLFTAGAAQPPPSQVPIAVRQLGHVAAAAVGAVGDAGVLVRPDGKRVAVIPPSNQGVHPMSRNDHLRVGNDVLTVLVSSEASDGAIFATEVRMPPGGGPPMMHRHAPAEVYLMVAGELTFYLQEEDGQVSRKTCVAGEVVPMAGDLPHTIRNESQEPATAISVHAPGAAMEQFARAAAAMEHPDMAAVLELAERHGIEMTGPIP